MSWLWGAPSLEKIIGEIEKYNALIDEYIIYNNKLRSKRKELDDTEDEAIALEEEMMNEYIKYKNRLINLILNDQEISAQDQLILDQTFQEMHTYTPEDIAAITKALGKESWEVLKSRWQQIKSKQKHINIINERFQKINRELYDVEQKYMQIRKRTENSANKLRKMISNYELPVISDTGLRQIAKMRTTPSVKQPVVVTAIPVDAQIPVKLSFGFF